VGGLGSYALAATYNFTCSNPDAHGQPFSFRRAFHPQVVYGHGYMPSTAFKLEFIPRKVEVLSNREFRFLGWKDNNPPPCGFGDPCYNTEAVLVDPVFWPQVQALDALAEVVFDAHPIESNLVGGYAQGSVPDAVANAFGLSRSYDRFEPDLGVNRNGLEFYSSVFPEQSRVKESCKNPSIAGTNAFLVWVNGPSGDWDLRNTFDFQCENLNSQGQPATFSRSYKQVVYSSGLNIGF
jgi:hypothetical protein